MSGSKAPGSSPTTPMSATSPARTPSSRTWPRQPRSRGGLALLLCRRRRRRAVGLHVELLDIVLRGGVGGGVGRDLGDAQPILASAGLVALQPADIAALEQGVGLVGREAQRRIGVAQRRIELVEGAMGGGAEDQGIDTVRVARQGAIEIGDGVAIFPLGGQ